MERLKKTNVESLALHKALRELPQDLRKKTKEILTNPNLNAEQVQRLRIKLVKYNPDYSKILNNAVICLLEIKKKNTQLQLADLDNLDQKDKEPISLELPFISSKNIPKRDYEIVPPLYFDTIEKSKNEDVSAEPSMEPEINKNTSNLKFIAIICIALGFTTFVPNFLRVKQLQRPNANPPNQTQHR
jgi:hypothetical protein